MGNQIMKCPKCNALLIEGKLYCETCGYEIQIVPDYEPEVEKSMRESLSGIIEDMEVIHDSIEDQKDLLQVELRNKRRKKFYLLGGLALFFMGIVILSIIIWSYNVNTFQYQYTKALEDNTSFEYEKAIAHLEKAISYDNTNKEANLMLANLYYQSGKFNNSIVILERFIEQDITDSEIYELLFTIYEKGKEYSKINEKLQECKNSDILTQYQNYLALDPEFSEAEGTYEEIVNLKLSGNTTGVIYYTIDGTVPDENSLEYTAPLVLDKGTHEISAIFINNYGFKSNVVRNIFHIDVDEPYEADISLNSGSYIVPEMIVVDVPIGCTVYFTSDGTIPTDTSTPYVKPFPLPVGNSIFKFIVYSNEGVAGNVVERTYSLSVNANVTAVDAVNSLVEQLCEDGVILDYDGHVYGRKGRNLYLCTAAFTYVGQNYYLVLENYEDVSGTVFKTGTMYAINMITGEIFTATQDNYGYYEIKNE